MALHSPWGSRQSDSPRNQGRAPKVAWRATSRLRNRIVRGYWAIDLETLVATAADDLPLLIAQLESAITTLQGPGDAVPRA